MEKPRNGIELSDKAKDRITGFTGTVTGLADYITGCSQGCLQPACDEKGDWKEARWFDVDRLEILQKSAVRHDVLTAKGGPSGGAPTR